MVRQDVEIEAADGRCRAVLAVPGGDGAWPGVLVFPDGGGARETLYAMADRLASLGYVVLVPDVYYGSGDWAPFSMQTVFTEPGERQRLFGLVGTLTNEKIVRDAGTYLDFLQSRPEVTGSRLGTTGYCMGGRMSLIAAGQHPDKVVAAASFHGGRIAVADDPQSPHLAADRMSATVYVAGAEHDDAFTAEQAALLDSALTAAGVRHTVEFYPARHGFAVPDNPTYDAGAEERHWKALEELFGAALAR